VIALLGASWGATVVPARASRGIFPLLLAAGLALTAPVAARAAEGARPSPSKTSDPGTAQALAPTISADTARMADWIASSRDNHSLPYAVIDKKAASLVLFDRHGKVIGAAPVLIGIALGDDATPGVGKKSLAQLGPAEKTTPAGRFLAKYGWAAGRQRVLWVDYADSVGLHPIPKDAAKSEHRRERMLSPTSDDNRTTFGCINVPASFYAKRVRPLFQRKGGYVYVTPDTKPIETVFPGLWTRPPATAAP
jgi:hypothetical protein